MSKLDFNQMMVEVMLGKAIKDLKANPHETLRRWVETEPRKPKQETHQVLLQKYQTLLRDEEGAYRALLVRMSQQVEAERLKIISRNLYYAMGKGAEQRQVQGARNGVFVPGFVSFDLGDRLEDTQLLPLIEQAVQLGITLFLLHCHSEKDVAAAASVCSAQEEAIFLVSMPVSLCSVRLAEHWRQYKHVVPVLETAPIGVPEAFSLLHERGFLYFTQFNYDASDEAHLRSGAYLKLATEHGSALALLWPRVGVTDALGRRVQTLAKQQRNAQRYPVLPVEVVRDIHALEQILTGRSAFLHFDGQGRRLLMEDGGRPGKENLFETPFLQILKRV